jgi:hypothetical protein
MDDNEFFRTIELASKFFKGVSASEYRGERLPCPIDKEIERLCARFMEASPKQRQSVSVALDEKVCTALFFFAERMAMLSVRQQSYSVLFNGLVALVIIGHRTDGRELLMVLSLIYRSAVKLRVDPETLFHAAVHYAVDETTRALILSYLQRSPENRNIASMGYREFEGPSGLVYWFGKQPIPEGLM